MADHGLGISSIAADHIQEELSPTDEVDLDTTLVLRNFVDAAIVIFYKNRHMLVFKKINYCKI